jgi:hypothetical protein
MSNKVSELVKMPKPNFCGNAGENVPCEHEIRYQEFKEKMREHTIGE